MRSTIAVVALGCASLAVAQNGVCREGDAGIEVATCIAGIDVDSACTSNECQCELLTRTRTCYQEKCPAALEGTSYDSNINFYCNGEGSLDEVDEEIADAEAGNEEGEEGEEEGASRSSSADSPESTGAASSLVAPAAALIMAVVVSLGLL